jgi:hypothetical protein
VSLGIAVMEIFDKTDDKLERAPAVRLISVIDGSAQRGITDLESKIDNVAEKIDTLGAKVDQLLQITLGLQECSSEILLLPFLTLGCRLGVRLTTQEKP